MKKKLQFKRLRRDLDTENTTIPLGMEIYQREHLIFPKDLVAVRRNIISEDIKDPDIFMVRIKQVLRKVN